MQRSRKGVGAATALGAVALVFSLVAVTQEAQAQVDPATRALLYMQAQQLSDGSIPAPAGSYDPSALYAIAAAADGYDPNALTSPSGTSVVAFLRATAGADCTSSTPGKCGRLIQAIVAAGADPRAFGGVDLISTLESAYTPSTGAYGDGQAFTQALAIQGLVAGAAAVPAAALTLLEGTQDSDGGWDYLAVKDDSLNIYDKSDTNSTAMVLMALDATGDHSRDASALSWLATQQDSDGGFPYQSGFGSDPDSTALVVQALVAAGQHPSASRWAPGGHTPIGYLRSRQTRSGGFAFPGNPSPDAFTTSQVPFAFEMVAFPVPFGSRTWYQPGASLGTRSGQNSGPTPGPTESGPPAGLVSPPPAASHTLRSQTAVGAAASAGTATPALATPGHRAAAPPSSPALMAAPPQSPHRAARVELGTLPAGGGLPAAILYPLVALGAAVLVGGAGFAVSRR